MESVRT